MIYLIVTVCMISSPETCRDHRLPFMAENVTPMECFRRGQVELVKFMQDKPNWRITKFRCSKPETEGDDT